MLGFAFRMYVWLTTSLNIHTKMCYTVNRGYNQPPVQSCEGKLISLISAAHSHPVFVPHREEFRGGAQARFFESGSGLCKVVHTGHH